MGAKLASVIAALRRHHGAAPPPASRDAFELVLWENVAYLANDDKRREAFQALRDEVGLAPAAILAAKDSALRRVTARGILKETFADKLRKCARLAQEEFAGGLDAALDGPLPAAKKALRRFPGIGEPGAEKILLFTGRHALLAPESNGLRVLVRVGLVADGGSYAKTWAASRPLSAQLKGDVAATQEAHLLLRLHGRTLCKDRAPACDACPLRRSCSFALAS